MHIIPFSTGSGNEGVLVLQMLFMVGDKLEPPNAFIISEKFQGVMKLTLIFSKIETFTGWLNSACSL